MKKGVVKSWKFLLSCLLVCLVGPAVAMSCSGKDDGRLDYPPELPFSFVRCDHTAPVSEEEMAEFSGRMRAFFAESGYIGWLLRMSHGIDDSMGMPDYRLYWGDVVGEKNGDTVSIIHEYSEEHGGHNILKGNSLILNAAVGGYLETEDPLLGELTRQFCNGISQTMLGMVHDENDPAHHLMARNIVTSNHTYTTHDGRIKTVDYSNWFFPYDRWNCSRFKYEQNPYWGEVWVTNTRSKDGLGYLYKAALSAYHAANHGADGDVRAACGRTWDLLTLFAGDITDNEYLIRSKDKDGNPYRPGVDPEPPEADIGDLASFTAWDIILPDAECNATQATALLAHGERLDNDCRPFGGHKFYEIFAIRNNPPNGHIMRSFHIANIALALHAGDNTAALKSLGGLEERFERDLNLNLDFVGVNEASWFRDIAVNWLQAATAGYYLTHDEIRAIHTYALRAVDEYGQWENWDLWADSVPEGEELDVFPPTSKTLEDGSKIYWFQPYVLGLFMEYCFGLNRNPDSPEVIDCDIFDF
ncbi:hypothetical protein ACFL4G_10555 [Thermodesulfobacteriota bacterium]